MAVSKVKVIFPGDVKRVWDMVTSLENVAWRSDLSKVEIVNDKQFIEYTKEGHATTFTVTVMDPCRRWEFDMENSNMKGHWTGVFTQKAEGTEVDFTEDVTAKKLLMKPFVGAYLKKQQAQYISDLSKELSC